MSSLILRSGGGQSAPATSVGIPVGAILHWSGMAFPTGWLLLDGAAWLRSQYPALWAFAQAEIAGGNAFFTAGDGTATFTARDCRGEFLRMADGGRGVDSGRVMGSWQNFALESHRHLKGNDSPEQGGYDSLTGGSTTAGSSTRNRTTSIPVASSPGGSIQIGSETRSRNVAVNFIIFAGV